MLGVYLSEPHITLKERTIWSKICTDDMQYLFYTKEYEIYDLKNRHFVNHGPLTAYVRTDQKENSSI